MRRFGKRKAFDVLFPARIKRRVNRAMSPSPIQNPVRSSSAVKEIYLIIKLFHARIFLEPSRLALCFASWNFQLFILQHLAFVKFNSSSRGSGYRYFLIALYRATRARERFAEAVIKGIEREA
jgi:hypothetical protein